MDENIAIVPLVDIVRACRSQLRDSLEEAVKEKLGESGPLLASCILKINDFKQQLVEDELNCSGDSDCMIVEISSEPVARVASEPIHEEKKPKKERSTPGRAKASSSATEPPLRRMTERQLCIETAKESPIQASTPISHSENESEGSKREVKTKEKSESRSQIKPKRTTKCYLPKESPSSGEVPAKRMTERQLIIETGKQATPESEKAPEKKEHDKGIFRRVGELLKTISDETSVKRPQEASAEQRPKKRHVEKESSNKKISATASVSKKQDSCDLKKVRMTPKEKMADTKDDENVYLKKQLKDANDQIQRLKNVTSSKEKELFSAQRRVLELAAAKSGKVKSNANFSCQCSILNDDNCNEEKFQKLEAKLEVSNIKCKEYKKELTELRQLNPREGSKSEAATSNEGATENASCERISELEKELSAALSELSIARREVIERGEKISELREENLLAARQTTPQLEGMLAEALTKNDNYKNEMADLRLKRSQLENENSSLKEKLENAKEELIRVILDRDLPAKLHESVFLRRIEHQSSQIAHLKKQVALLQQATIQDPPQAG